LNSANLQLTSARELLQARSAAAAKLAEINKREIEASGAGPISGKTAAEIDADRAKVLSDLALQESGIRRVLEVKKEDLKLIEQQTKQQTAYTELFTGAFKSMEDAIVEFTKTGKLSFSSMIESFLEGLLRYEIQQAQVAAFSSIGGARGLANLAISFFGGSPQPEQLSGPGMNAKGNVYDYGIQAFAKGGMFTNSIVDSPTLFKFAKGTGLMGEAGPEAIMPLTRDGSGNLGVRAEGGGSNVDVVVNNYGSEKATTKETVDSRGNRRIEVTVGDMVAQEVTRTGSAAQTAFSSTYGTRPALARR
jgi:phage-related minor tail protein